MVSALEWAEIRALGRDGVSQRQIAKRLGINRRTVARALAVDAPPRYVRAPAGSQLDPLMGVIGQVLEQWPDINRAHRPRRAHLHPPDHTHPATSPRPRTARRQTPRVAKAKPARNTRIPHHHAGFNISTTKTSV